MIDRKHAVYTQVNNVVGTLNLMYAIAEHDPSIHLVKLGTMGEYGTPEHRHRRGLHRDHPQGPHRRAALPEAARLLLPPVQGARQPQHPVRLPDLGPAGHRPQPGHRLRPGDRRDRRCTPTWPRASTTTASSARCSTASASRRSSGHPLTVYGKGGQTRGMLDIRDTLACVELAVHQPAGRGRVPGLQPVHRVVLGHGDGRAGRRGLPRARCASSTSTTRVSRRKSTTTAPRTPSSSTWGSCPTCSSPRPSAACSPSSTATATGSTPRPSGRRCSGGARRAPWPPRPGSTAG